MTGAEDNKNPFLHLIDLAQPRLGSVVVYASDEFFAAKERLIEFRNKYKILENLIPHTDIASYLGITNISLSRLRKDLMS